MFLCKVTCFISYEFTQLALKLLPSKIGGWHVVRNTCNKACCWYMAATSDNFECRTSSRKHWRIPLLPATVVIKNKKPEKRKYSKSKTRVHYWDKVYCWGQAGIYTSSLLPFFLSLPFPSLCFLFPLLFCFLSFILLNLLFSANWGTNTRVERTKRGATPIKKMQMSPPLEGTRAGGPGGCLKIVCTKVGPTQPERPSSSAEGTFFTGSRNRLVRFSIPKPYSSRQ